MISLNLYAVREKQIESDRLAAAVADFWRTPGGRYREIPPAKPSPPPKRRDWIDPETVLYRKPKGLTAADRKALRLMANSL
ncbi:hypothetical protein [Pseudomonas sp. Q1]|uniref:hypothetical protein n=1 Tax=Pseudomonas sp. Q1 TaxID=2202823 RepID=UPI001374D987|nr:hypothetical protein [Pseudomonas sp. Q1]NCE83490.1 hypothetical protein [Pseudomonas sp. Q1]